MPVTARRFPYSPVRLMVPVLLLNPTDDVKVIERPRVSLLVRVPSTSSSARVTFWFMSHDAFSVRWISLVDPVVRVPVVVNVPLMMAEYPLRSRVSPKVMVNEFSKEQFPVNLKIPAESSLKDVGYCQFTHLMFNVPPALKGILRVNTYCPILA